MLSTNDSPSSHVFKMLFTLEMACSGDLTLPDPSTHDAQLNSSKSKNIAARHLQGPGDGTRKMWNKGGGGEINKLTLPELA